MNMVQMKILPNFFQAVVDGDKTFEIRKDDREIRVGDLLLLKEWENDSYTGRGVIRRVCYILRNAEEYGLMKGYVLLGIEPAGLQFRGCTKDESR